MATDAVHNERVKLTAAAFDRASTAALTIGVFAPIAAALYTSGPKPDVFVIILSAIVWLLAALALHWGARLVLGGLKS